MEAGVGRELTGDYRDVTPWVFGTSGMAGEGSGRLRVRPEGAVSSHRQTSGGHHRRRLLESGPGRRPALHRDWKGPHVFCSQRLDSHLVIGNCFCLAAKAEAAGIAMATRQPPLPTHPRLFCNSRATENMFEK